jgi:hypothetical protein
MFLKKKVEISLLGKGAVKYKSSIRDKIPVFSLRINRYIIFLEQCLDNNSTSQVCPTKRCQTVHSTINNKFEQICVANPDSHNTIHIRTIIDTLTHNEKQWIAFEYGCDECNLREIFPQIQECVDQYYDLSPMRKILGYDKYPDGHNGTDRITSSPFPTSRLFNITQSSSKSVTNTEKISSTLPNITSGNDALKARFEIIMKTMIYILFSLLTIFH